MPRAVAGGRSSDARRAHRFCLRLHDLFPSSGPLQLRDGAGPAIRGAPTPMLLAAGQVRRHGGGSSREAPETQLVESSWMLSNLRLVSCSEVMPKIMRSPHEYFHKNINAMCVVLGCLCAANGENGALGTQPERAAKLRANLATINSQPGYD